MRAIICGAGHVGYSIAAYLSKENNDVTVIDSNPVKINKVSSNLDVRSILGHAANPDILAAAGANSADLIIAVTLCDEVNMVACQVAHSLFNMPKKIARIRERAFLDPAWCNLFSRAHMPIDVIISPELEVARSIVERLSVPGTTNVIPMANKKVHLCSVICEENCPIVNTQIKQLESLFPETHIKIVAIFRGDQAIVPGENDQMEVGDEVYFVADTQHIDRALSHFGHEEKRAQKIVIVGGGHIGLLLADEISQKMPDVDLKIIEKNEESAEKLSNELDNVIVVQGDTLERGILEEVQVGQADTLIAVTNDDETNILVSLLAKQQGCKEAVTLVNKTVYTSLMGKLGIGAMLSPQTITVSTIMQHVRRGRIKQIHNIRDGCAEVIEAEISETSEVAHKKLKDITFPKNVIVGALIRGDEVIMPTPELQVEAGDELIVLAAHGTAQKVEKMVSVQMDLF